MAEAGDRLRIRFGLAENPSPQSQTAWAKTASALIAEGVTPEDAGERAAFELFAGCYSIVYATEGDTIEMLVALILSK